MARMSKRTTAAALVGFLTSVLWPAAVLLARNAKARAHGAPELESSATGWALLCALAALAGICVVAFKSAKRTHLD